MVEAVGPDSGVAHLLGDAGPAVGVGAGVDVGPDPLGDEGAVVLGAEADSHGGGVTGDLVEDLVAVEDARTGRPVRRAASAVMASMRMKVLAPKAPPIGGTTMRTSSAAMPKMWARSWRMLNGVWVPVITSSRPSTHWALVACGSIGHVCRGGGVEDLVDDDVGVEEGVGEDRVGVVEGGEDGRLLAALEGGGADPEPVADVGAVLGPHVEVGRVGVGGVVLGVDELGARPHSVHLVVDRRGSLVGDLDQGRSDPGVAKGGGDHCGDGVADELGLTGQDDLVGDLASERREVVDVVGGDEDDLVVEQRGLEAGDSAGGDLGADDAQVPLARDAAVDGVAEAGDDARVDAADAGAGAGAGVGGWRDVTHAAHRHQCAPDLDADDASPVGG